MFLLISVDQIELDSFLLVPNFYNIWWISHGVLEISQQAADFKGGLRTNGGFEQLAENFFRGGGDEWVLLRDNFIHEAKIIK